MKSSNNINIASRSVLSSPGAIRSELPLSLDAVIKVMEARQEICDILDGKSKKFMMIVGPCSIHNPDSAIEYAERLRALSEEVKERILIVMRVYFEKPRTTLGWKGLIYDPDLNASYNIEKGIFIARRLMLKIVDLGLPVATEMLDPIIAQYIADAVSWAAIGARTTEAHTASSAAASRCRSVSRMRRTVRSRLRSTRFRRRAASTASSVCWRTATSEFSARAGTRTRISCCAAAAARTTGLSISRF